MGNMLTAKNKLLIREPFFGYLLLKLNFIEDASITPPTMQVDGRTLWYHPSFIADTSTDNLTAVLVHELLHCVLEHPKRGAKHNPKISNYAADYVINDYIINKTSFKLPESALYDVRFQNMGYEEVYKILMDECDNEPDPTLVACSGLMGSFVKPTAPDKTAGTTELLNEDFWKTSIREAATLIKMRGIGVCPAGEEIIESTVPAQLPWQHLLSRFLVSKIAPRSNWNYPNRRYAHTGLYLPSKRDKGLKRIVIAIDTSGSVRDSEFAAIIAEINRILVELRPEKLILIHCDSQVAAVEEYTYRDAPFSTSMKGRGYTDFKPVFDYINQESIHPDCLVYFTDLYCDFDFPEPQYPVLWVNTDFANNKLTAPFGENIGLNL